MILPFAITEKWLKDALAKHGIAGGSLKDMERTHIKSFVPSVRMQDYVQHCMNTKRPLATEPSKLAKPAHTHQQNLGSVNSDVAFYVQKLCSAADAEEKRKQYNEILDSIFEDYTLRCKYLAADAGPYLDFACRILKSNVDGNLFFTGESRDNTVLHYLESRGYPQIRCVFRRDPFRVDYRVTCVGEPDNRFANRMLLHEDLRGKSLPELNRILGTTAERFFVHNTGFLSATNSLEALVAAYNYKNPKPLRISIKEIERLLRANVCPR